MGRKTVKLARVIPVLLLTVVAADCARNPATGERELALISESQEIQMGREADQQIVASIGVYENESLQRYVADVGARLAAVAERPELPWTFRVLDDPTVNAFALPGGFVYITRGIMSHLTSEAELAGILGHEVAHITARHSVNQISKAQLTQLGVGIGMILVPELQSFAGLADVGMQLLFLKYGRDDENQADELGVRYMTRLEYDPRQLADVMAMLQASSRVHGGGGGGALPEWLSTHPDPANRVEHIQALAQELEVDLSTFAVRREPYLRRIDGIVFGADPREGFFEDDVFYHPELRFRWELPGGWQRMNTKQAVQVVAPDQDAAMLLTLAQGSPSQALREFSNQQGVQVGRTSQRSINGLSAVIAEFGATTEQGALVGLVVFVSHGGNTYRLLGYAPQQRWNAHSRTVESSLLTFAPENSASVLDVQPATLDLVEIGSTMSFGTFLDRYPSTVEPEIIALINHVSTDGQLPGGTLAKRVVGGR